MNKARRGDLVVILKEIEAYLEDEQMNKGVRDGLRYYSPQKVIGQFGVVLKKEVDGVYYVQYGESSSNFSTFDFDEFEVIDNVGLEAHQMWHYYRDEVETDPIYQLGLKHGEEDGKQKLSGTIRKNIREILKGIDPGLACTIFGMSPMSMRGQCGCF